MKKHFEITAADGCRLPATYSGSSSSTPAGVVILSHGIFSDRAEQGRFDRQVVMLNRIGFATLQYDFRGHGAHGTPMREVTVSGMVLDLQAAASWVRDSYPAVACHWVAASFGAAICLLYLQLMQNATPQRIVFLNPVLDFRSTILPRMAAFTEASATVDASEVGTDIYLSALAGGLLRPTFLVELQLLDPAISLRSLSSPARIIHGTGDRIVPYDVTRELAGPSTMVDFQTIPEADHGFTLPADEQTSFDLISEWLTNRNPTERHSQDG